jgi:hypothetical protein
VRIKQLVGRALSGLVAVAATAAMGLVVAPQAIAATPLTAGVDASQATSAFRSGAHVYVYPGGSELIDAATQAKISSVIAGSHVYLAVVKSPSLGALDSHSVNAAISSGTGRTGSYVLLGIGGAGTFMQVTSPVAAKVYGTQLRAALKAHHDQPGAQALALVTALAGDKLPAKPFPWAGVVTGALLLLLVVAFALRRRLRPRSSRAPGAVPEPVGVE